MTNICINCIHHHGLAGSNDHFCRHPNYTSEPDLVTGSQYFTECGAMRRGDCGREGKFFQSKPIQNYNQNIKSISDRDLQKLFSKE